MHSIRVSELRCGGGGGGGGGGGRGGGRISINVNPPPSRTPRSVPCWQPALAFPAGRCQKLRSCTPKTGAVMIDFFSKGAGGGCMYVI